MKALVRAGWPYALLVAGVLAGFYAAYSHGVNTEQTRWKARTSEALQAALDMATDMQEQARNTERASAQAMQEIDNAYIQGRDDAQKDHDAFIAERDAGAVRLRDKFTCPDSRTSSDVPEAGTSTSQRNDGTPGGLQRADEDFLIRLARRADDIANQLSACQAVVRRDREGLSDGGM